jgi:hypothetical protein
MAYKFQIGAAKLSGSTQFNDRVDVIGDIDLSASSIDSVEIAELNAFDTGDLSEGSNLYYTEARWDAKMAAADTGDLSEGSNLYYTEARWDAKMAAADTGDLSEGSNLYFTDARARAAVSVTDNGGDGSLSYNSSTGVISYTGPSASEVRAHFSAGDGLAVSNGDFSVNVDDSSIEISSDTLQVKALGITNAMLAGGIASSKLAELNNFDTADLAEGSNLYWTTARGEAMFDSKLAAADTDDLSEGSSNLYHTTARVRAAVSAVDAGGDGSFSYDSSTGAFTYTGPSAAEVRAHLSVTDTNSMDLSFAGGAISADAKVDDSSIEINASNGLQVKALGITNAMLSGAIASSKIAELNAFDTDGLSEGSSNLYYTEARWDAKMAAADTDDLSEGSSNLYYTDARVRAAVSAVDAGGDGSFSYDSSTGAFTYTGPSASEVRAHFSAGTGVAISSGVVSIGQAVATSDSVTFASGTFTGDMTVAGDLEVQGALTYINTANLEIQDNEIILNKGGNLGAGATAGLRLEDGAGQDMIFQWNGSDGQFELLDASGAFQNLKLDNLIASTLDLSAGGAIVEGIQTIAASAGTTAMAQKSIILVGKANTVTLAAAASLQGVVVKIKNNDNACGVGADAIVIEAASGEQIEGGASIRLESPGAAIMVISDGSDWFVM